MAELAAEGLVGGFDRHWVAFLRWLEPGAPPEVIVAGTLARAAIDRGHLCLDLGRPLLPPALAARCGGLAADCRPGLENSALVSNGRGPARTPLVLDRNRLYLFRYWQYETRLAEEILARAGAASEEQGEAGRAALAELTAAAGINLAPDQERAVLTALARKLAVISGGPGTGKTTIVFFILALLQKMAAKAGRPPLRIMLLAPTGKAAARLSQAVQGLEAMTIHRALGFQSRTPTTFRHDRHNPLPVDLVVVDEASMVDVALMSKLLAAVPEAARLVLLGDKDQLASVEAGSILGDICLAAAEPPLAACVIQLQQGFRFDAGHGIGALTRSINAGDADAVLALLAAGGREASISLAAPDDLLRDQGFRELVLAGFHDFLMAVSPAEALARLGRFRLLCAHRRGWQGVAQLNRFCEQTLAAAGLLRPHGEWYQGRPLLITANDYSLRLFNGDLGVIWEEPDGQLRACFLDDAGQFRTLAPGRLPAHETAFAMTIHKSQGSEFERVAVILPWEVSPVLTRELLYTAVSRAREEVRIFGREEVIRQAVATRVERISGLADRLRPEPDGSR